MLLAWLTVSTFELKNRPQLDPSTGRKVAHFRTKTFSFSVMSFDFKLWADSSSKFGNFSECFGNLRFTAEFVQSKITCAMTHRQNKKIQCWQYRFVSPVSKCVLDVVIGSFDV